MDLAGLRSPTEQSIEAEIEAPVEAHPTMMGLVVMTLVLAPSFETAVPVAKVCHSFDKEPHSPVVPIRNMHRTSSLPAFFLLQLPLYVAIPLFGISFFLSH